jgi:hypothetical protein
MNARKMLADRFELVRIRSDQLDDIGLVPRSAGGDLQLDKGGKRHVTQADAGSPELRRVRKRRRRRTRLRAGALALGQDIDLDTGFLVQPVSASDR